MFIRSIYGKYTGVRARRVLVLNKSAAKLTGRLTPPRHPRAAARGRRDKHTSRKPYRIKYGKAHKQGSQKVSENFLGRGAVTAKTGGLRKQSAQKAKFTATTGRGIAAEPLGDGRAHSDTGIFPF